MDELKLNGIETSSLLSPVDTTLGAIERNLQIAAFIAGLSAWKVFEFSSTQVFYFSLGLLFLWTLDAVSLCQFFFSFLDILNVFIVRENFIINYSILLVKKSFSL